MPLGFQVFIPEGWPKIARRFNAGTALKSIKSRMGRLNLLPQPSLRDLSLPYLKPGVETPGYFRLSLRDREDSVCSNPSGIGTGVLRSAVTHHYAHIVECNCRRPGASLE